MCVRASVTLGRPAGRAGTCKIDVDAGGNFCSVLRTRPRVTLKGASVSRKGVKSGECAALIKPASVSMLSVCMCGHVCVSIQLWRRGPLLHINGLQMSVCSGFVVFAIQKY